ncbi:winged helix-turn-helix transcriptional regulator [Nocardia sp. NPDC057668]|uniref:winged helix-turn-helix transcriptional regulator n=1 Tax=Nocardia sp. NPDC057668 TaxID=3346202 RepID=UPI003670541D
MAKRSYNQYCGIAAALDLLGERWSLLIVRNLLLGPKRFKDLLEGLPGIGTGLLSQRLKELDAAGLITRDTLPPPAASAVYRLTADGEALRPVLYELSRWGSARLGELADDQYLDPELVALALEVRFDRDRADGTADGSYELAVDGHTFGFTITGATIDIRATAAPAARTRLVTDARTLAALNAGSQTLARAVAEGALTATGDLEVLPTLARLFGAA